jgi:hypothetical protein
VVTRLGYPTGVLHTAGVIRAAVDDPSLVSYAGLEPPNLTRWSAHRRSSSALNDMSDQMRRMVLLTGQTPIM